MEVRCSYRIQRWNVWLKNWKNCCNMNVWSLNDDAFDKKPWNAKFSYEAFASAQGNFLCGWKVFDTSYETAMTSSNIVSLHHKRGKAVYYGVWWRSGSRSSLMLYGLIMVGIGFYGGPSLKYKSRSGYTNAINKYTKYVLLWKFNRNYHHLSQKHIISLAL